MRLLDTRTLSFVEGIDYRNTYYTVLSHRWSGEEITFDEYAMTLQDPALLPAWQAAQADTIRGRHGYAKIMQFCVAAREAGCQYCWVDTCCIDKRSSEELSEAINRYGHSALCLVYLADVPAGSPETVERALRKSVWWTRSWALQELLAPARLRFYSGDWTPLLNVNKAKGEGDYPDALGLATWIANGTFAGSALSLASCIPQEVLLRWPLGDFTKGGLDSYLIAEKMSWAARRVATRDEDVAYSLLGLFGVHMPLLYGEGTRAYQRLQEALIARSGDDSIFAWEMRCQNNGGSHRDLPRLHNDCTSDTLLAPAPAFFLNAGKLLRLPEPPISRDAHYLYRSSGSIRLQKASTLHYHLTNRGLEMKGSGRWLEARDGSTMYLVIDLHCWDEHLDGKQVVLRFWSEGTDPYDPQAIRVRGKTWRVHCCDGQDKSLSPATAARPQQHLVQADFDIHAPSESQSLGEDTGTRHAMKPPRPR